MLAWNRALRFKIVFIIEPDHDFGHRSQQGTGIDFC
jgi:hypothetical protein